MEKNAAVIFVEWTVTNDVLQTAALLSHFVPFIKNVLHQFTSAWSHLANAILFVHIWQVLMETDGIAMQCSKNDFCDFHKQNYSGI
jgi:hypothetical protein